MSRYIKIIASSKNELRADTSISIGSLKILSGKEVSVKIDTGCSNTSIPIQKLGVSRARSLLMKQQDSLNPNIKKKYRLA